MRVDDEQLKSYLLEASLVSSEELQDAKQKANRNKQDIGSVLVSMGFLSEKDYRKITSHILAVPFVSLYGQTIDFETLSIIPEPIARKYNIVAYSLHNNTVEIALLEPKNINQVQFLKSKYGLKLSPRLTDDESMRSVLIKYQKDLKKHFGESLNRQSPQGKSADNLEDNNQSKAVDTLLRHALMQRATDIHIEPTETSVLIRYRIDGVLHSAMELPLGMHKVIEARVSALCNFSSTERGFHDGVFSIKTATEIHHYHVSSMPTVYGSRIILCLTSENVTGFTLEKLDFSEDAIEEIHKVLKTKAGLILVGGPEESGKTTTLYTLLDTVQSTETSVVTIEDEVEAQLPGISQVPLPNDADAARVIKRVLKSDVDILMINALSAEENLDVISQAVLLGKMVFASVSSTTTHETLARLGGNSAYDSAFLESLKLFTNQRLIRRISENSEEYTLSEDQIAKLGKVVDTDRLLETLKKKKKVNSRATWNSITFKRIQESEEGSGYEGFIGIQEVLPISSNLKEKIKTGSEQEILRQIKREKHVTLLEDAIMKAVEGKTTLEEALRVS